MQLLDSARLTALCHNHPRKVRVVQLHRIKHRSAVCGENKRRSHDQLKACILAAVAVSAQMRWKYVGGFVHSICVLSCW